MKRNYVAVIICVFFSVIFLSCKNQTKSVTDIVFLNVENEEFERTVKDKVYYSKWFPNIQSSLEFDIDNNKAIFKQYYASRYDATLGPNDKPKYPVDQIYISNYQYFFSEDLSHLGLRKIRHYRTSLSGKLLDEFNDYNDKIYEKKWKKENEEGTIIKWDYETMYTAKVMDKEGIPNYILNP